MTSATNNTYPSATEAVYRTPSPNAAISLYRGRLRVSKGSLSEEGDGVVEARWLPTPEIVFSIPALVFSRMGLADCTLDVLDRGWSFGACIESSGNGGMKGQVDYADGKWLRSVDGASQVSELRLHLPNFIKTGGEFLALSSGDGCYAGRLQIDLAPWKVRLDALDPSIHEALKKSGGFAFTHVLVCERADGAPFEPTAADAFIARLDMALSFCLGQRTGGTLVTGHEANGRLIWEHWRQAWVTSYKPGWSWFPRYYAEDALKTFLSGFVRASEDPVAHRAICNCIHWYIDANANQGIIEGSITMTVVALELLAWLELVNRGGMPPEDFDRKDFPAHEKVRRYLKAKSIQHAPTPPELPALVAFVLEEQGCADGVEALTRIRNRTVHPPKKSGFKEYPGDLLEQAWRYSLYLLERAVLAETGYSGQMHHRLEPLWPMRAV